MNNYFKNLKNEWNVRKQRRNILKLNYYDGLIQYFALNLKAKFEQEEENINKFYQEKFEAIQKRIDGIHHFEETKEKKLNKFDNKLYWKLRRFKVKFKNENNYDELLNNFKAEQTAKRDEFLNNLDNKYPRTKYSEKEINDFKNNYKKLEENKKLQIEKNIEFFNKGKEINLKKVEKINLKINKIKDDQEKLEQLILKYNEELIEDEKIYLNNVEESLKEESLKPKVKEKLLWQQTRLNSKIKTLDDDEIHLSVTGLKMFFGGVKAVNDLTFDVKKGEIFGLIGPNGAGKTTVFNCVTQFYRITDGHIYFRNKEEKVVNLTKLQAHQMVNEGLTRSFQNIELVWELNILDNLLVSSHSQILSGVFSHAIHSLKMKREEEILRVKAYNILKMLGIEDYAYYYPVGLAYGVLKKIELARTLMTDPTLIILDEPAAGLNEIETLELAQTIKKINKEYGITIFLVEHDMGLVMSISDRVLAINFGRELALGTPEEIKNNSDVRKAYLGDDDDE